MSHTFRFKTVDECADKYGNDWRAKMRFNPEGQMDYLMGSTITLSDEYYAMWKIGKTFDIPEQHGQNHNGGHWSVLSDMITEAENKEEKYRELSPGITEPVRK
jgi:hypothetical protein